MLESGLRGRFWFKAACAGKDVSNVTYKQRLGSTPYTCMYGEVKDVSRFTHFNAGSGYTSTWKGGRMESSHPGR